MNINENLQINGEKVLLVGFRWFQNMGDDLLLLGNIKLLQKQKKEIYVVSQDNERLKTFLSQEIDCSTIHFLDELPRGIRSGIKYLKKNGLKQRSSFKEIDTIILWGGEILTEESPHAYYYRFRSIRPALFCQKKLYLMGGIQIPQKWRNKILFHWILKHTTQLLCRDFEEEKKLKEIWLQNVDFFMDTSYFVRENWKGYRSTPQEKYLIINMNSKGERFLPELIQKIKEYSEEYALYFVPVCCGWTDDDGKYFEVLKKDFPTLQKLEWKHFEEFLKILWGAEKVLTTRLHLFLISSYIGVPTHVFPYQKKINKMKNVLQTLNITTDE